ncbi:Arrestin domain-containing protein 2 [Zootermopsis nevadensis]|uniref:Arrestin domain-containing protein 2 n=2 Tax=Zootermopsis nevadensis TaxID=136037 RepID=A0A067RCM2_ZOONE|nr:Arrestin domain-containing protein 2 [Zootermopsis nevadensis]
MDKGDCGLQSAVAFFTVNDILDLNEIPKCRKPRTYWAQQDGRRLFCFKCRSISAVLNIPRRGFVSGEKILINAEINNLRSKPISYVKATLVQVIKYNHKTGHRKIKRIVAEVLRGSVMPYESQVWKEEPLHIPPVAASKLVHCSLMDIRYILYLQVCSPKMATGKTIKLLKVPVIIGTVPLRQQQQQQELEEDKGGPLLSGTSLPAPISEPCVFGPYSITDVYGQDGVQITFTPLYATYSVRRDRVLELDN